MLTFSLFLISVARHPGQRFLLYDGALLLLAGHPPNSLPPLPMTTTHWHPPWHPCSTPKAWAPQEQVGHTKNLAGGCQVWHDRSSWCRRPNHHWCFTAGVLTEARQMEESLILKQVMVKISSIDTINWNLASKPLQIVKFKYWVLNCLKWWCRNLQFHLFISFWLWAE